MLITATDVIRLKDGVQVSKTASTVGTINVVKSKGQATVTGGSTGVQIEVNQRPLREDKPETEEPGTVTFHDEELDYDGTVYWLPKGYEVVDVVLEGLVKRQNKGAAIYHYSVEYDGFRYGVDPVSAVTNISVIARRIG